MAVYEDRHCPKCRKVVRMIRCEICKGRGGTTMSQCRQSCNMNGWLCPVHGKNYLATFGYGVRLRPASPASLDSGGILNRGHHSRPRNVADDPVDRYRYRRPELGRVSAQVSWAL